MGSASISQLKAHLSRYLAEVRRGGEVQVLDRGRPVARLVRVASGPPDGGRRERLIRAGVLRAGTGDLRSVLRKPLLLLPKADLSGALDEERGDRL